VIRVRLLAAVMLQGQHVAEGVEVSLEEGLASSLYDRGLVDLIDEGPAASSDAAALDDEPRSFSAPATASAAAHSSSPKRR